MNLSQSFLVFLECRRNSRHLSVRNDLTIKINVKSKKNVDGKRGQPFDKGVLNYYFSLRSTTLFAFVKQKVA